jgi:NAD(P)-dependent dehydrogenase (short-subunit alcohol dehydrogenase family)
MSLLLQGRRCLVTGGGTGIGAGIAQALAGQGARVAVLGRRKAPLAGVVASLGGAKAGMLAVAGDVTRPQSMARACASVRKAFGGLDIVVANAGVGGPNRCAVPGPDRWDAIVRTNLDGLYHTVEAALPLLADGGRVVAISSVLGRFGVPGYTAYCASKHGVLGFVKALALELAPRRITVNAICPGWVDTEMATAGLQLMADGMKTTFAKAKAQAMAAVPLGRLLEPAEIGATVAWLCSDGARGMTGLGISHCGGQVMW